MTLQYLSNFKRRLGSLQINNQSLQKYSFFLVEFRTFRGNALQCSESNSERFLRQIKEILILIDVNRLFF